MPLDQGQHIDIYDTDRPAPTSVQRTQPSWYAPLILFGLIIAITLAVTHAEQVFAFIRWVVGIGCLAIGILITVWPVVSDSTSRRGHGG